MARPRPVPDPRGRRRAAVGARDRAGGRGIAPGGRGDGPVLRSAGSSRPRRTSRRRRRRWPSACLGAAGLQPRLDRRRGAKRAAARWPTPTRPNPAPLGLRHEPRPDAGRDAGPLAAGPRAWPRHRGRLRAAGRASAPRSSASGWRPTASRSARSGRSAGPGRRIPTGRRPACWPLPPISSGSRSGATPSAARRPRSRSPARRTA